MKSPVGNAKVKSPSLPKKKKNVLRIKQLSAKQKERATEKKKQVQQLKKIEKATELYSMQWMPKGSRTKLTWTIDVFHAPTWNSLNFDMSDDDNDSDNERSVAKKTAYPIKEERLELAEQTYDEHMLPSVIARLKSVQNDNPELIAKIQNGLLSKPDFDNLQRMLNPLSMHDPENSGQNMDATATSESVESKSLNRDASPVVNGNLSLGNRPEQDQLNKRIAKKYSLVQQKDFYAALIQELPGQDSEHLYPVQTELETTEATAIKDPNSVGAQREALERLQLLKESSCEERMDYTELESLPDESDSNSDEEIINDSETKSVTAKEKNVKFKHEAPEVDGRPVKYRVTGTAYWTLPMYLSPGPYILEIGSPRMGLRARSERFNVTEAFGVEDTANTGTWCICEEYKTVGEYDHWVQCKICKSWHHWQCYEHKNKKYHDVDARRDFRAKGKALNDFVRMKNQDRPVEKFILEQRMKYLFPHLGSTFDPELVETCIQVVEDTATKVINENMRHLTNEKKQAEAIWHLKQTEVLEAKIIGHPKGRNDNLQKDFTCWMCKTYEDQPDSEQAELELLQVMRLVSMINKSSGGYKKQTEETEEGIESKRDYSSPMHAVCYLGCLLNAHDNKADLNCADLGAGEGRLGTVLPYGSLAVEKRTRRFKLGRTKLQYLNWLNEDVLDFWFLKERRKKLDVIVCNPDFDVALSFIVAGLFLLRDSPDSKMYFLLPSDFFEASAMRSRIYRLLPFKIEEEHKLGHLCYLETDPTGQKLSCDSFFVLTRGRESKYAHSVINARLGGML